LALHPSELHAPDATEPKAFFARWVRKEAMLKALGIGLAVAPSALNVSGPANGWAARRCPAGGIFYLLNVSSEAQIAGAIAVSQPAPLELWRAGERVHAEMSPDSPHRGS
jgi:phosphopantetheinyl transferase (holo-ACP synthase)